jgi:hypothetical protein
VDAARQALLALKDDLISAVVIDAVDRLEGTLDDFAQRSQNPRRRPKAR